MRTSTLGQRVGFNNEFDAALSQRVTDAIGGPARPNVYAVINRVSVVELAGGFTQEVILATS